MAWETENKRVRGTAINSKGLPLLLDPRETPTVYVRFEKDEYDPRAGKEIHGKLYDTPEEAIAELGSRVVERVLRDEEFVTGVHVNITLSKWTED